MRECQHSMCGDTCMEFPVAVPEPSYSFEQVSKLIAAMGDLLAAPMGTVPRSAGQFYDGRTGRFDASLVKPNTPF